MLRHLSACRIECDGCGRKGTIVYGYGPWENARRAVRQAKLLGWLAEQGRGLIEETRWRCPRCQVESLLAAQGLAGVRVVDDDDGVEPFVIR